MINVSNEFKQLLAADKRNYKIKLDITLKDGTALSVLNDQIWADGFSISDATSGDNSFDIGSAISNKLVVSLKNLNEEFSSYDFDESEVVAWTGLELSDGTIEYIRKGSFFVDESDIKDSSITLECLDYMCLFDRPYSDSKLSYPATLSEIVIDICNVCGVQLLTSEFRNSDYVVKQRPSDEALTCRDMLSFVAQLAASFAKVDTYGRLKFDWYVKEEEFDGFVLITSNNEYVVTSNDELIEILWEATSEASSTSTDSQEAHRIVAISSQEIALYDVEISGILVVEDETEEQYLYGEEGYVLSISSNPLIQSGEGEKVAGMIGAYVTGLKFRPMSIACLSDPTMEAGDLVYVVDRKGNVYTTFATSVDFKAGSYMKFSNSAETPSKKRSTSYGAETKIIAKTTEKTKREIKQYDLSVQMLGNIISQSFGVFQTKEIAADGSTIYYLHNKQKLKDSDTIWKMTADAFAVSTDGGKTWNAGMDSEGNAVVNMLSAIGVRFDWATGGLLTLGGYDNVSGQMIIKGENGEEIGRWNKEGFSSINVRTYEGYTADDMTRLQQIIVGLVDATDADYEKLDMNGDGEFDTVDMLFVQWIIDGYTEWKTAIHISPEEKNDNLTVETKAYNANGEYRKVSNKMGARDSKISFLVVSDILKAKTVNATSVTSETLTAKKDSSEAVSVYAENSLHKVALHVSAAGNGGLYDSKHSKWLVRCDKDGNEYLGSTKLFTPITKRVALANIGHPGSGNTWFYYAQISAARDFSGIWHINTNGLIKYNSADSSVIDYGISMETLKTQLGITGTLTWVSGSWQSIGSNGENLGVGSSDSPEDGAMGYATSFTLSTVSDTINNLTPARINSTAGERARLGMGNGVVAAGSRLICDFVFKES